MSTKNTILLSALTATLVACGDSDSEEPSSSSSILSSSSSIQSSSSSSAQSSSVSSAQSSKTSSVQSSSASSLSEIPVESELVAFPGAEGYGKVATGGRGGAVFEVTTLDATGKGSLSEALSAKGPRTVVFRVGGTIKGDFTISNDNITVAGQTAPGDGIAINGHLVVEANNVILRYLRVRGDGTGDSISNNHNKPNHTQIYDHISVCWSGDEIFSVYFNENITIQYSMIYEANSSDHQYGAIWGNNFSTYHHNLFAHNTNRNPRIASGSGYNDLRNNVIYNWSNNSLHGGEKHEVRDDKDHVFQSINVVGNYYKPGPATKSSRERRIAAPWSRNGKDDYGFWHITENVVYGHDDLADNNWAAVSPDDKGDGAKVEGNDAKKIIKLDKPSKHVPIPFKTAEQAYQTVLADAGASMPRRDSLDTRIIEELRTGTATNGNGLTTKPGPLPQLQGGTPPQDSDHDGMPDDWEVKRGLNPNNPDDRNKKDAIGYTMLEHYLNSIDSL